MNGLELIMSMSLNCTCQTAGCVSIRRFEVALLRGHLSGRVFGCRREVENAERRQRVPYLNEQRTSRSCRSRSCPAQNIYKVIQSDALC